MKRRTKRQLDAIRASPETTIALLSGCRLWSETEIDAYKHTYAATHGALGFGAKLWNACLFAVMLITIVVGGSALLLFGAISIALQLLTSGRLSGGFTIADDIFNTCMLYIKESGYISNSWHRFCLFETVSASYAYRDGPKEFAVPPFVATLLGDIKALHPHARFYVHAFGTDPILEVCMPDGKEYYPLVWDVDQDGVPFVVNPSTAHV